MRIILEVFLLLVVNRMLTGQHTLTVNVTIANEDDFRPMLRTARVHVYARYACAMFCVAAMVALWVLS